MKLSKKITSLLIAASMTLSLFGVNVSASNLSVSAAAQDDRSDVSLSQSMDKEMPEEQLETQAAPTSGSCGESLTWSLESNGTLTISGTGKMSDYQYADEPEDAKQPWFNCRQSIKSIVFKDGVTSIGAYAFIDCDSIEKVTIPSNITMIGEHSFAWCSSLTEVVFAEGCKAELAERAIFDCSHIKMAVVPSTIETIGKQALGFVNADSGSEVLNGFSIIGDAGTAAEAYAQQNNIPFSTARKQDSQSALKATKLSSVKWDKKKKQVTVTWEKNTKGKGYEVQYSTDKKYKKGVKTVKISKNKTVKITVKKLKSGKTYYFRIRTVNGKNHSKWSSNKSVKVR